MGDVCDEIPPEVFELAQLCHVVEHQQNPLESLRNARSDPAPARSISVWKMRPKFLQPMPPIAQALNDGIDTFQMMNPCIENGSRVFPCTSLKTDPARRLKK